MTKERREPWPEGKPGGSTPQPRPGGFRLDGSWDPEGTWKTPLGDFVRLLVMGRRFGYRGFPPYKASPADIARMIREGPFPESFGNLSTWNQLEARRDWPVAYAATATAETVKRCGWGMLGGAWEEEALGEAPSNQDTGRFVPHEKDLTAWEESVSRYQS